MLRTAAENAQDHHLEIALEQVDLAMVDEPLSLSRIGRSILFPYFRKGGTSPIDCDAGWEACAGGDERAGAFA